MGIIDALQGAANGKGMVAQNLFRILAASVVGATIVFEGYALWAGKTFDVQAWGIGIAAILGASAAAVFAHSYSNADGRSDGVTPAPGVTTATQTTTVTSAAPP